MHNDTLSSVQAVIAVVYVLKLGKQAQLVILRTPGRACVCASSSFCLFVWFFFKLLLFHTFSRARSFWSGKFVFTRVRSLKIGPVWAVQSKCFWQHIWSEAPNLKFFLLCAWLFWLAFRRDFIADHDQLYCPAHARTHTPLTLRLYRVLFWSSLNLKILITKLTWGLQALQGPSRKTHKKTLEIEKIYSWNQSPKWELHSSNTTHFSL